MKDNDVLKFGIGILIAGVIMFLGGLKLIYTFSETYGYTYNPFLALLGYAGMIIGAIAAIAGIITVIADRF